MQKLNLIFLTLLGLSGCAQKMDETPVSGTTTATTSATTAPVTTSSLSYLALGDSYTIGQSVPASDSFPFQLTSRMTADKYIISPPKIIATTGWTTTQLITAITNSGITQKFDFVTLLIGVNNQYQGLSQDTYRTEFVQLLNTAISFAGNNKKRVFVLSIPDYSVTPFAAGYDKAKIATEIDQFNAINKAESLKASVNYEDITAISRQASQYPALIANDGLHPSGIMYAAWVDTLYPDLIKSLK